MIRVNAARVHAEAEAMMEDQRSAFSYLESKGFVRVGRLGNRWKSPVGRVISLRNALRLAVRADLEEEP